MTILQSRRRFLFTAPAIVAVTSLMPSHSVAHLLVPSLRSFTEIGVTGWRCHLDGIVQWCGSIDGQGPSVFLTLEEVIAHIDGRLQANNSAAWLDAMRDWKAINGPGHRIWCEPSPSTEPLTRHSVAAT